MGRTVFNILHLGVKELWSLWRDPIMLVLILFVFTVSIYTSANSKPETLHNAAIAIVDEDESPLSQRIVAAFYPPQFTLPRMIAPAQIDPGMDAGDFTFVNGLPRTRIARFWRPRRKSTRRTSASVAPCCSTRSTRS